MSIKVSFDLDCVCVSTLDAVLEYINERLPVNLKPDDIKTYCIENALPEQYRWIVETAFHDSAMWKKVKLLPNCAPVLQALYYEGYEIIFATSSLPENLRKKINHLTRNTVFFPDNYVWRHTVNIHDKYLLDVDIHVDDCPTHIIHPDRHYYSIVMDYAYNRKDEIDKTPCVTRAYDWADIYDKIHMITDLIKEN